MTEPFLSFFFLLFFYPPHSPVHLQIHGPTQHSCFSTGSTPVLLDWTELYFLGPRLRAAVMGRDGGHQAKHSRNLIISGLLPFPTSPSLQTVPGPGSWGRRVKKKTTLQVELARLKFIRLWALLSFAVENSEVQNQFSHKTIPCPE